MRAIDASGGLRRVVGVVGSVRGWRPVCGLRVLAVVLAVSVSGAVLGPAGAGAQSLDGSVVAVRAWSDELGVLRVAWEAASPLPTDYRVSWAPVGEPFKTWRDLSGNAFPESNSLVLEDLDADLVYRVKVRARYHGGQVNRPWSGAWSDVVSGRPSGGDVAGTVLAGVMSWGASTNRGLDVVGYTRAQRSGATEQVGGFEMRYWDDAAVRSADLRAVGQIQGLVAAGPAAGLDYPVVLTMSGAADLSSGFVLEVGDFFYDSVDAVNPQGTVGVYTYWMWDSLGDRWQLGDQAEFRVIARADGSSGAVQADASLVGLGVEGATLGRGFDPEVLEYSAVARPGAAQVTVDAVPSDSGARSVRVSPPDADADADGHQIDLNVDGTPTAITVKVIAADKRTTRRYTIAVTQPAAAPTGLRASVAEGAVRLSWDPSPRVAPLRDDAPVVYAVWRESVDGSGSGFGGEPVVDGVVGTGFADSDVAAGGTYRYGVSVHNEGYANYSLTSAPVTVEVPAALGGDAAGLARFSVGESGSVEVQRDARRYDVDLGSGGGQTTVSLEASALDVRLEAQTVRGDQFILRDQDLGQPVYLSDGGDTLVIVRTQSPDGTREQAYVIRLQPPADGGGPLHRNRQRSGSAVWKGVSDLLGGRGSDAAAPSLSALVVSSGTLAPAFSATVRDYTASVSSDVNQITVTPTAATGTNVLVAAPDADPGTAGHQVALNASTQTSSAQTAIVIVVSNSAGRLDSYTVTVTRTAVAAGDAALSALAVGDLALHPAFDPATTAYTATAGIDLEKVTVTAAAAQSTATVSVTPADSDIDTAGDQVALVAGDNTVTVTVTAQDNTTKTYTVTVTRPQTLSGDATLARLDLSGAQLSPRFGDASFPEVTMELPDGCALIDFGEGSLAPFQRWDDTCESLRVADYGRERPARYYRLYVHKESLVSLRIESSTVTYLVLRSADGDIIDEDVYRIGDDDFRGEYDHDAEVNVMLARGVYVVEAATLFRHPDRASFGHRLRYRGLGIVRPLQVHSGDEDITEVVVGDDTHIYAATVSFDAATVTVDAAASHDGARVIVSPPDADPDTDGHQIALAEPAADALSTRTAVAIAVVAQDGTRNTYAVIVTRPPPAPTEQITMKLPGGCELHDLGAKEKTPWRRWDDSCDSLYRAHWEHGAQFYRLYVLTESLVHLRVDGNSSSNLLIRSPSGEILHHDGQTNPQWYDARLTAVLPRGVYVVEVAAHWHHFGYRGHSLIAKGEGIERPHAYRLEGIDISDVSFDNFDPNTTDYTRNIAADVTSVTVTPTPTLDESVIEISPADADPNTDGRQVTLDSDGSTDIIVGVYGSSFASQASTDEIAELTTTYTITLNQLAGTTSPLSNDATLSGLSLSGIDIGTFAPNDHRYTYTLSYYQNLNGHFTTVSPTTTAAEATWNIGPEDADSGTAGHQVKVNGDDTITVTVTAQSSDAVRTYTLSPGLPASMAEPSANVCTRCGFHAMFNRDLWVDGDRIMVGITAPNSFAVFDMNTGQRVETFTVPGAQWPSGNERPMNSFWTDGETLWVTYWLVDTIRAYDFGTRERLPAKDLPYGGGSIWSDGTTMYANDRGVVSAYDIASKQRRRTTHLEGSWFNVRSSIWSDGITLWVAEEGAPTIKAYELKTGTRLPGLDLRAHDAHGMWTNGAEVWVLGQDDSIYGYTLPENARLKQLSLDVGDIGLFTNGVFSYSATVPAGTTMATITAVAAFSGGSSDVEFSVADADTSTEGHQVSLTQNGTTTVNITVTAPNGTDTETYSITIT